jgi:hypothetical protein
MKRNCSSIPKVTNWSFSGHNKTPFVQIAYCGLPKGRVVHEKHLKVFYCHKYIDWISTVLSSNNFQDYSPGRYQDRIRISGSTFSVWNTAGAFVLEQKIKVITVTEQENVEIVSSWMWLHVVQMITIFWRTLKSSIFWDMMPCIPLKLSQLDTLTFTDYTAW